MMNEQTMRKKKSTLGEIIILIIPVIICLSVLSVYAQDKKEHPLDQWLEKCVEKDDSTAGMLNCSSTAYDKWEKELNKNYQELMKAVPSDVKPILKNAQLQWIKYKDAEFKLIAETEGRNQGTMWLVITNGHRMRFIKERALELKNYLENRD